MKPRITYVLSYGQLSHFVSMKRLNPIRWLFFFEFAFFFFFWISQKNKWIVLSDSVLGMTNNLQTATSLLTFQNHIKKKSREE